MNQAQLLRVMRKTKTAGKLLKILSTGNKALGGVGTAAVKGLKEVGVKNPTVLGAAKQSGRIGAAGAGYAGYQSETGQGIRDSVARFQMGRMRKKQRELMRSQQVDAMRNQLRNMQR